MAMVSPVSCYFYPYPGDNETRAGVGVTADDPLVLLVFPTGYTQVRPSRRLSGRLSINDVSVCGSELLVIGHVNCMSFAHNQVCNRPRVCHIYIFSGQLVQRDLDVCKRHPSVIICPMRHITYYVGLRFKELVT